ncbi:hypothetical protein [Deinococcus navajonensis]|uniref:Uncharacterized protein n=1 Tax=Deinococcus navajonensis TaxID=309884 RepID=A0ABV8XHQ6_9DEIO
MPTWIRTHRRTLAVFSVILVLALLAGTEIISNGKTMFFSVLVLTFLYRFREGGTYTVDHFTTPGQVALHAGASVGGPGATHAAVCGDGGCS